MTQVFIGILVAVVTFAVVQTVRLNNCQGKAKHLEVCLEVDKIEEVIRDETDQELIDRISRP